MILARINRAHTGFAAANNGAATAATATTGLLPGRSCPTRARSGRAGSTRAFAGGGEAGSCRRVCSARADPGAPRRAGA